MAGHSKWLKVKRIKGPLDVKRGARFSKLVKEIAMAARLGGGDLPGNPRLRSVAETARGVNTSRDNIMSVGDENVATRVLRLYETLEDNNDTQNVYSNFDIPDEVLARLPA